MADYRTKAGRPCDPAGQDLFDHLRKLVESHPDSRVTLALLGAIHGVADNAQDGAPDAGAVARACTWIAALAHDELADCTVEVAPAVEDEDIARFEGEGGAVRDGLNDAVTLTRAYMQFLIREQAGGRS